MSWEGLRSGAGIGAGTRGFVIKSLNVETQTGFGSWLRWHFLVEGTSQDRFHWARTAPEELTNPERRKPQFAYVLWPQADFHHDKYFPLPWGWSVGAIRPTAMNPWAQAPSQMHYGWSPEKQHQQSFPAHQGEDTLFLCNLETAESHEALGVGIEALIPAAESWRRQALTWLLPRLFSELCRWWSSEEQTIRSRFLPPVGEGRDPMS